MPKSFPNFSLYARKSSCFSHCCCEVYVLSVSCIKWFLLQVAIFHRLQNVSLLLKIAWNLYSISVLASWYTCIVFVINLAKTIMRNKKHVCIFTELVSLVPFVFAFLFFAIWTKNNFRLKHSCNNEVITVSHSTVFRNVQSSKNNVMMQEHYFYRAVNFDIMAQQLIYSGTKKLLMNSCQTK